MTRIQQDIYADGIRFKCRACGGCCRSHGEYVHVYVSLAERRRLARHLGMPTRAFTMKHCEKQDSFFHLKDTGSGCIFLQGKKCSIHSARPEQCRTWPFWPENMSHRAWSQEVLAHCPGIGEGKLYSPAEIEKCLKEEQRRENRR